MTAVTDDLLTATSAKKLTGSSVASRRRPSFARKNTPAACSQRVFERPGSWPFGQISTGQARIVARIFALAGVLVVAAGCQARTDRASKAVGASTTAPVRGGQAVASIRSEPRSFNRFAALDSSTDLVSTLTQAKLVRINKVTQDVEPWLAEKWTADADRTRYTLTLRRDVTFSDGRPFTADDV